MSCFILRHGKNRNVRFALRRLPKYRRHEVPGDEVLTIAGYLRHSPISPMNVVYFIFFNFDAFPFSDKVKLSPDTEYSHVSPPKALIQAPLRPSSSTLTTSSPTSLYFPV